MERRVQVFTLALEAVQSSYDAHGYPVPAQDAWDFISNCHAEADDPVPFDTMPPEFRGDYIRLAHEQAIRQGRPKSVLTTY